MDKLQVIVFLPAYNEEESIGMVIRNIPRDFHDKVDVKVLVIDDGSSDRTVEVSIRAGADYILVFQPIRDSEQLFALDCANALKEVQTLG